MEKEGSLKLLYLVISIALISNLIILGFFLIKNFTDDTSAINNTPKVIPPKNDTFQHRKAGQIWVAANDSISAFKAEADFICDGVSDQDQINAAIATLGEGGGEVVLSDGTFVCSDRILPTNNITLMGRGEEVTTLVFKQSRGISLRNQYHHVTLKDFSFTGSGQIFIDTSHNWVENVTAFRLDNSRGQAFYVYASNEIVEDVHFRNCTAIDCNRWGFVNSGEGIFRKIMNSSWTDCQAINSGRYGQWYVNGAKTEAWDVGFDIAESVDVENLVYERCLASGSWESGFHAEFLPTKKNIRLINCTSNDNGQKWKEGGIAVDFGAGFLLSTGMTCEGCNSKSNIIGYVTFGNGVVLINSTDSGSIHKTKTIRA